MERVFDRQPLECGEARLARQFAGKTLADHCAQAFAALSQRYCHAMHGAGAVHGPANWRQVFLELVRSVRLRPHQDAAWLKRPLDIGERASRIRHIVDAIEGHHQVEAVGGGNVFGGDPLEDETIAESRSRGLRSRSRDSIWRQRKKEVPAETQSLPVADIIRPHDQPMQNINQR